MALMPSGTMTSTTAPWWPDRAQRSLLHRLSRYPQEFISALKWGYLYQGQWSIWQKQRRGTPCFGLTPATFVTFLQNHDQIANSGHGLRCHGLTSPGRYKALTAMMLLGPGTPMLFQGQEFASSSPFFYFADFEEALDRLVRQGRAESLHQFPSIAQPEMQAHLPDPAAPRPLPVRSSIFPNASATPRSTRSTAIYCGYGVRILCFAPSARAGWTGPSWGRKPSCCVFSARIAMIGCWW